MTTSTLTAISPLEGRYFEKLTTIRPVFTEYGLMKFRVQLEIQWLQMLAEHGNLAELPPFDHHTTHALNAIIEHFSLEDAAHIKKIETGINHDVKAVEYFIKERIATHPILSKISEFIHFGCTSEDINNLAYALMLQTARTQCILPALDEILVILKRYAHDYADVAMLARTHGQPATPTTVGKEFANFAHRLHCQIEHLSALGISGKLNGATGNYSALATTYPQTDWQLISKNFVSHLGLVWNPYTTQIEPHDNIAEYFHILIRINTILIDLNRDMWGYIALHHFSQKSYSHEVGSSTMPHKVNPIDFENAEGNLGISNALLDHMAQKLPISRWQRDLSDSTVLRNMGVAIAHAVLAYQATCKGLNKISPNISHLNEELNHHWEVLAEPIQMMMRRYGIDSPYEQLKQFSRDKKITKELLHEFIRTLALPDEVKQQLCELSPANYIGSASDLAKRV